MNELKNFCRLLAEESGMIINRYWRKDFSIERKADSTPVTIADKKAEELMREMIMKHFPEHGIIGEEFGVHNKDAEYKWILDPIDGTKSFIHGTVTFGTLIALTKNGKPIFGAVNQPVLKEFLIGDNETAFLNEVRVRVRNCYSLESASLLTTDHRHIEKYQNLKKFENLMRRVNLYRQWGDCYGYYLIATGYADIMIDPIMSVWDSMAVIPIIRGAGGTITDYQGNNAETGNSIIATSGFIHSEVIKILN
ncbi:MAG: Fructose-1 6-bisphosphatase-like protein [Ignavibacteria bacterium]|nr:MAG: Fructose-1 6-bisphosphatase-like protein [Ignavibacteria bacterium]KAF0158919.1 MAG: Fructose-1 6-bisphosphatase-like protein [Ignavibacteria bacterium]